MSCSLSLISLAIRFSAALLRCLSSSCLTGSESVCSGTSSETNTASSESSVVSSCLVVESESTWSWISSGTTDLSISLFSWACFADSCSANNLACSLATLIFSNSAAISNASVMVYPSMNMILRYQGPINTIFNIYYGIVIKYLKNLLKIFYLGGAIYASGLGSCSVCGVGLGFNAAPTVCCTVSAAAF